MSTLPLSNRVKWTLADYEKCTLHLTEKGSRLQHNYPSSYGSYGYTHSLSYTKDVMPRHSHGGPDNKTDDAI